MLGIDVDEASLGKVPSAVTADNLGGKTAGDLAGARAYGLVNLSGQLVRSKNIVSVTDGGVGVYCITPVPDIDVSTAVLLVGSDLFGSGTLQGNEDEAHVEWHSVPAAVCPSTSLRVHTFVYDGDQIDDDDGGGNSGGDDLSASDGAFTFVIP